MPTGIYLSMNILYALFADWQAMHSSRSDLGQWSFADCMGFSHVADWWGLHDIASSLAGSGIGVPFSPSQNWLKVNAISQIDLVKDSMHYMFILLSTNTRRHVSTLLSRPRFKCSLYCSGLLSRRGLEWSNKVQVSTDFTENEWSTLSHVPSRIDQLIEAIYTDLQLIIRVWFNTKKWEIIYRARISIDISYVLSTSILKQSLFIVVIIIFTHLLRR